MRRRWIIVIALGLTAVLLALAAAPWWFGPALQNAGSRFGLTFAHYERLGYARFAVTGVIVRRANVEIRIDRVEADTPLLWGWRHLRGGPHRITATGWAVNVTKSNSPPLRSPSGWVPLRRQLERIATNLNRWVPDLRAGKGVVRWPGGEITLDSAHWQSGMLTAEALRFGKLVVDAKLAVSLAEDELKLTATNLPEGAGATLDSRGAAVAGTITWWNQTAKVTARYGAEGWVPPDAILQTDELRIPGDRLMLGATYALIRGFGRVEWQHDHFLTDVALRGEPVPHKKAPPLEMTLRGHGDTGTFTIDALHAALPGIVADLSAPVTIDRTGALRESAARFSVQANLEQQPWFAARGLVRGEAQVITAAGLQSPGVEFHLAVEGMAVHGLTLRKVAADGRLQWPRLHLAQATVTGTAGDELRGSAEWDFRDQRLINAAVKGMVRPATIAPWMPPDLKFEQADVDLNAAGDAASLNHAGRLKATNVRWRDFSPFAVEMNWRGRGAQIEAFSTEASTVAAKITASGTANPDGVQLVDLAFLEHDVETLKLTEPVRITWRPALTVEHLSLAGPSAGVEVNLGWGLAGHVKIIARGFRSGWIRDFAPLRGPDWSVSSLALTGTWDHGPMTYSAAGSMAIELGAQRGATIDVAGHGGANGLHIDALRALESGNPVVNASGVVPVMIRPGTSTLIAIEQSGRLVLEAMTVPNAAFWQQLAAVTGVELRDPQMVAHLAGTWTHPTGELTMRAAHASSDPKRFSRPLPSIDDLDVAAKGDMEGVRLDRFSFRIEGQLVHASGRLPVPKQGWSELAQQPMDFLRRGAQLRIEIPDAQVAMFKRFLPAALAPAGRLEANVTFDRGTLGGFLRLRDAASRPLGPLGVLQQVSADIEFSDQRVNLRQVTATAGGEPVTLAGTVQLPTSGWLATGATEPKYDIALKGRNLPFVRESGLLVRGDLDLSLRSPATGPPKISGHVTLRDSLFLSDIRAFLPHGPSASPDRRPPYFSIAAPPLNTWGLDVEVSGTRFMRLRMPVFSGVASARFHLSGTLGEPRAIGDAIIEQGLVLMPFATFNVTQGAVRLTEEDPYEPTIFLRGTGRHYGYDLTMELSGKASAPNIEFTSSPALDSEQVLLMVMTGAAPSNEVNTSLTHRAVQIGAFVGQGLLGSVTGSNAGAERLSIESGEKISLQGRETYQIEYKLNDRWSVTGEYDEFDEYNAGFKWRVAPKKEHK